MKLAVFEIDGVLYAGHTIFDIIKKQESEGLVPAGTWEKIELSLTSYKSGDVSYKVAANNMLEAYFPALKGKTKTKAKRYLQNFMELNKDKFYPYFEHMLPRLNQTHDVYLLTTNLHTTAEVLVERFGLKGFLSTEEEILDGIYMGNLTRSLAGNKQIISELLQKYSFEGSIAVGDSINDIPMLELVEFALAMNPDHGLQKEAQKRNWEIVDENSIEQAIFQLI